MNIIMRFLLAMLGMSVIIMLVAWNNHRREHADDGKPAIVMTYDQPKEPVLTAQQQKDLDFHNGLIWLLRIEIVTLIVFSIPSMVLKAFCNIPFFDLPYFVAIITGCGIVFIVWMIIYMG